MNVLLDTQVLVWSLFKDKRLSTDAAAWINDADKAFVSVASIYEIDFKRRDPGRLRAKDNLLQRMPANMPANIPALGYILLPINADDVWRAARLPIDHGDPWDRILLAQAMTRDLRLVSADSTLRCLADAHSKTRGIVVF